MRAPKLFNLVRRITLPSHAVYDPITRAYLPVSEELPAIFAVHWPDGTPCSLVEMYLLDIGCSCTIRESDGGTLKTKVSKLSPLIRYCWTNGISFRSLNDDTFREFITLLQLEMTERNPPTRKRKNRTINAIIDECISFLTWLQTELPVQRVIVGTRNQAAQIRLIETHYQVTDRHKRTALVYPHRLPDDAPDPKSPMPREIRNRLWDAVAESSNYKAPKRQTRKSKAGRKTSDIRRLFIRARRELILLLLEATGCRPAELVELQIGGVDLEQRRIVLPTMKRRKSKDPIRSVPIDMSCAAKLEVFLELHRDQFLRMLRRKGIRTSITENIFVNSKNGGPMSAASITKEFQRLVTKAGVKQRACMSMFRHRFITNMIKLHLAEFLEHAPGKTRALMTESDYRTIVHKVVVITGHADEDSVMHYFDAAWEEMGVFDYVQPAIELAQAVETSVSLLTSLAADLRFLRVHSRQDLIAVVTRELNALKQRTIRSIDDYQRTSRKYPFADSDVG